MADSSTVESHAEVGWARGAQEEAEAADAERLFREAEQACARGDYSVAGDVLHRLRADAEREGDSGRLDRVDRRSERVRSGLHGLDLTTFDQALASGAARHVQDTDEGGRSGWRIVVLGTLGVLAVWLALSLGAAASMPEDDFLYSSSYGGRLLLFLVILAPLALGLWLLGLLLWLAARMWLPRRHRARAAWCV